MIHANVWKLKKNIVGPYNTVLCTSPRLGFLKTSLTLTNLTDKKIQPVSKKITNTFDTVDIPGNRVMFFIHMWHTEWFLRQILTSNSKITCCFVLQEQWTLLINTQSTSEVLQ